MSYDVIGDIHGYCAKLEALLRTMGYREAGGTWRHPARTAVFVGDFVDRGPEQLCTVRTVRRMVDAGTALAVMGNHELNAIAWHTTDPRQPGEFLRPHHHPEWGAKNRSQHAEFLAEVEDHPALHTEIVNWFLTLPLWLELPGLRVVHACWHEPFMSWLAPRLDHGRFLSHALMADATNEPLALEEKDNSTPSVFKAVECLTKGIEIPLPADHKFIDKDGHVRTRVRVRWWEPDATTYRSAAMLSDAERNSLPELPIPAHARIETNGVPIFFGHYWLTGTPTVQSAGATCVDYSAGKGGPLVAYRFDGETDLTPDNLTWVD